MVKSRIAKYPNSLNVKKKTPKNSRCYFQISVESLAIHLGLGSLLQIIDEFFKTTQEMGINTYYKYLFVVI